MLKNYKTVQDIDRENLANQWIDNDRFFTQWNGLPMRPQTPYYVLNLTGKSEFNLHRKKAVQNVMNVCAGERTCKM